jgi:hypothetical protein
MKELFENWGEIKGALLEGLDPRKKKVVDTLLENQKQHILNETAATGSTDTTAIAGFRKILIPMIRRIIPGTIATEIVGVQPMSGPVGLVYSLRYKYNQSVPGGSIAAWDTPSGAINVGVDPEAFSNVNPLRRFYSGAAGDGITNPKGQPAGAGGFDPAGFDTTSYDPAIDNATAQGYAWPANAGFTSTAYTNSGASALNGVPVGGSLYGGGGGMLEGSGGRQMSLEIVSQAVEAGSRKLQASWTIEAMQDMQAQHGLDLENEMTTALSAEIVQEIDNEILADLITIAGTVGTYDGSLPGAPGYYSPTFVGDRFANLGAQVMWVANEVARKTRRGAANFMVCSPMIVSVLQVATKSVFAPAIQGAFKGPNNSMLVGTLNGTVKVYSYLWNQVNPTESPAAGLNTGNDTILMGYKGGNGELDVGYFYCPYIPLMSSGVVINPSTFQPVVSLMTRYGKTAFLSKVTSLGNSADYYAKINVTNLTFA